jgi:hypothetical protein
MSDENHQHEQLRERIAGFFRAEDEGPQTPVPAQEAEALATAAGKLEQMLADVLAEEQARREAARAEELRALQKAAGKLEQMLRGAGRKEARERRRKPENG